MLKHVHVDNKYLKAFKKFLNLLPLEKIDERKEKASCWRIPGNEKMSFLQIWRVE